MMRVLLVVLSLWAAVAAADHGTEVVGNSQGDATQIWLDSFKTQVAQCYNPGQETGGSVAFASVTFQIAPDAKPIDQTIRLSAPTGQVGETQALAAARLALLRCGQNGYDLPLDQFSQWQFVEISFYYYVPLNG